MKKISLSIIIVFVVVFGIQAITFALSDVVQIKLRQHIFLIPKQNALERESIMPDWLLNMSGLDDGSNTTLFLFDDQEVKASVPSYQTASDNQFKDDLEVLMAALIEREINDYQDPRIYAELVNLWKGTGSYKNRKVESAEIPGWYKVYRQIEYPNSWVLVNQLPDPDKPIPSQVSDFWVATCLMQGMQGKRGGRCTTHEIMDDIFLEFSVSDYNLPVLDEVRAYIKTHVQSWKVASE